MNAYMFRRRSDISLMMMMPLWLSVERKQEMGQSLSLLQVDLEHAFGTGLFDVAWGALKA